MLFGQDLLTPAWSSARLSRENRPQMDEMVDTAASLLLWAPIRTNQNFHNACSTHPEKRAHIVLACMQPFVAQMRYRYAGRRNKVFWRYRLRFTSFDGMCEGGMRWRAVVRTKRFARSPGLVRDTRGGRRSLSAAHHSRKGERRYIRSCDGR